MATPAGSCGGEQRSEVTCSGYRKGFLSRDWSFFTFFIDSGFSGMRKRHRVGVFLLSLVIEYLEIE